MHAAGCRKYFNVTRHTVTYEILETYKVGERPAITDAGTQEKKAVDQE